MRMDSVIETFDFKRYKNSEFRKVQKIYDFNINNIN